MAKLSYAGANVLINADTFASWLDKTNQIIYDLSTIVVTADSSANGAATTGNVSISGIFGGTTLFATTGLRGGTVSASANLAITSNANFSANVSVVNAVTANTTTVTTLTATNANVVTGTVTNLTSANAILTTLTSNSATIASGSIDTLTGNCNVQYNSLSRPTIGAYAENVFTANASGALNLDLSNHNVFYITLTANSTLTMISPRPTGSLHSTTIILLQDATGGRTVTIGGRNSANTSAATMRYPNATVPIFSSAANSVDVISYITFDGGTNYHGALSLLNSR